MNRDEPFRAVVRYVIPLLEGRGCVIVLENGFQGTVKVGQVVQLGTHTVSVNSVEFVDQVSTGESWVALVVDQAHLDLAEAQVGQEIFQASG